MHFLPTSIFISEFSGASPFLRDDNAWAWLSIVIPEEGGGPWKNMMYMYFLL